jgi:putative ABC transport system permease protein
MFTDLSQALRLLRHSPGFSALIVIVLALGIGANTAIFIIVSGVLLKPLPFDQASRIVAIDTTIRSQPDDSAYLDVVDWRAQSATVEKIAAYATAAVTLTGRGEAASIPMAVVTPDLFSLLGVAPIAGRLLAPTDDVHGAERTAVISEALWARYFGRDRSVIGKTALLDGDAITIVGVMPAAFEFPFAAEDPAQIWMPVLASRFSAQWADERGAFLKVVGRLRPGVGLPAAQSELSAIAARVNAAHPQGGARSRGIVVRPFQDVLVRNYPRLGAAGLAIGVSGALAVTRVLDSLLFGVTASDPLTFAAVSAALVVVLLLAAYLPARRATRVDPILALRAD